jgi:hypothetical protein
LKSPKDKIGPLFKWFGSKWQSAKHYPQPQHQTIIEPFAGGAGYSLNYYKHDVVIWEDDPLLKELWHWLIHTATSEEILDIPVGLAVGTDIRTLQLTSGQALLLKHWQRTNNVGNCWTISPWGDKPGQWTENTRNRVSVEVMAIKHWEIAKPIDYIDNPSTWFIDPPYLYNYRYNKNLPDFDFSALSTFVGSISRQSLVVVCEAENKLNGEIPDYLPFVKSHRSVTSRRKTSQSHHSSEVIYVREPIIELHT